MMRRLQDAIARALHDSNVKGRTTEELTQELEEQFGDEVFCMEGDFHSFESVLRYDTRSVTEIAFVRRLMSQLDFTQAEKDFFEAAYCSKTIHVRLAGIDNVLEVDHAKRSGSYLTSILNGTA